MSLSYNQLGDAQNVIAAIAKRCPMIEHLNLMKNPCNPVFSNDQFYQEFRAKFKIWIPSLKTLDGTDFKDDQGFIEKMSQQEIAKKHGTSQSQAMTEIKDT